MRQRIEDLGRILVLLEAALDIPIMCSSHLEGRRKDFETNFMSWDENKQREWLHETAYGLDLLNDKLHDILTIAKGEDYLNESV